MTDDMTSGHLTPKPPVSIAMNLNGTVRHEISAMHPDITLNSNLSPIHVFPNTLDFRGIATEDYFHVILRNSYPLTCYVKYFRKEELPIATPNRTG